jgi:hypothetical protein
VVAAEIITVFHRRQRDSGGAGTVPRVDEEPPPIWDPDALPRVLGRAEALERGFSRRAVEHRLATGRWRRILPRTYLTADELRPYDRLYAALSFAGDAAALSGAAALYASEVRRIAFPDHVLVLVPPANATRTVAWVQVRRSARPVAIEQWYGPRRVEIARAAADLAVTMRRLDDVRTVVARVVQHRHCTIEELAAELESGPRRGSKHLRQALTEAGWGAASAPEAKAARILRRAGLRDFVQNAELRLPDGSIRVVDFYWSRLRACLEIDSVEWHFERDDWAGTWDRHLDLSKFGYSVIHRPPSALDDERRFIGDVTDWLAGREADLRRGLA